MGVLLQILQFNNGKLDYNDPSVRSALHSSNATPKWTQTLRVCMFRHYPVRSISPGRPFWDRLVACERWLLQFANGRFIRAEFLPLWYQIQPSLHVAPAFFLVGDVFIEHLNVRIEAPHTEAVGRNGDEESLVSERKYSRIIFFLGS